jgi:hypothetical protein
MKKKMELIEENELQVSVPLRNQQHEVVGYAIVDKEDEERVLSQKWYKNNRGYAAMHQKITQTMHAFLIGKAPKGFVIDHINRNRYDNRKCNLRYITYGQNNQNRTKKLNTTSKFLGVCFQPKYKKPWVAMHCGKWLGNFLTEIEAAFAYDLQAQSLFAKSQINGVEKPDGYTPFQKQQKKTCENLPKGVMITRSGNFSVQVKLHGDVYYQKVHNTLESAIEAHKKYTQEMKLMKQQQLDNLRKQPIRRNDQNVAILHFRNGESFVDVTVDDDVYLEYIGNAKYIAHGYPCVKINGKTVDLHTLVIPYDKSNQVIDHIDRNVFNCLRSNVRNLSYGFNAHNSKKSKTNRYCGVFTRKYALKNVYNSKVVHNGETHYLGQYNSEEVAAWAFDQKSIELYGPGGQVNNVQLENYLFHDNRAHHVEDICQKCKTTIS